jgi:acyl carrier protein
MTAIETSLMSTLAQLLELKIEQVSLDVPFAEQGLDSLLGMRLARKVADISGLEVDPAWMFDYPSVRTLAAFLETRMAESAVDSGSAACAELS